MADAEVLVSGEAELSEADLAAVMPHLPELERRWLVTLSMFASVPVVVLMNRGPVVVILMPMTLGVALFVYFQLGLRQRWPKRALGDLGAGATTFRFDDFGFSASSSLRRAALQQAFWLEGRDRGPRSLGLRRGSASSRVTSTVVPGDVAERQLVSNQSLLVSAAATDRRWWRDQLGAP